MRIPALLIALTGVFVASAVLAQAPPTQVDRSRTAVLRGLDKVSARISTFEAPVGDEVRFGSLRILVQACNKRPPEETPETTAFLEVTDMRPGQPANKVYTGWMFASSPALSALEHPVYDVWVIDCKIPAPPVPAGRR